ncbi:hypothetical protein SVAN01_05160 [Stagonosporopsis vannaccii]|nr:hypothetical protein SVAN01_05160 [Stagonosporopsis vannaccii]
MLEYDLLAYRTMNNMDSHPRVLSLSSSTHSPSTVPTPTHSYGTTPRASTDSQHAAHHFVNLGGKTERSLNSSIRKLWREVKEVAREHHRSVNAAYEATHGAGLRGVDGVKV